MHIHVGEPEPAQLKNMQCIDIACTENGREMSWGSAFQYGNEE